MSDDCSTHLNNDELWRHGYRYMIWLSSRIVHHGFFPPPFFSLQFSISQIK